jgi:hypothetical protein
LFVFNLASEEQELAINLPSPGPAQCTDSDSSVTARSTNYAIVMLRGNSCCRLAYCGNSCCRCLSYVARSDIGFVRSSPETSTRSRQKKPCDSARSRRQIKGPLSRRSLILLRHKFLVVSFRARVLRHTSNIRQRAAFRLPLVGIGRKVVPTFWGLRRGCRSESSFKKNSMEDDDHAKIDNMRIDTVGSADGIRRRGQSAFKLSLVLQRRARDKDLRLFHPRPML